MPRIAFATSPPSEARVDLLILPLFQGPKAGPGVEDVGRALGEDLVSAFAGAKLKGKLGEALTVPTFGRLPAKNLLLVGVGEREGATADTVRRALGKVAPRASRFARVATTLPQLVGEAEEAVQAAVEGILLGSYRFDRYKADGEGRALSQVTLLGGSRWNANAARRAIRTGEVVSDSVTWARDLVNTPALDATPEYLAGEARRMAKEVGLTVKVWTEPQLKQGGFGGILGVGAGSVNRPRLVELTYRGAGQARPIALTGKGVTFDSGGLSIKDAKSMEWMKSDMGGAAAMLGVVRTIGILKPKVNVIAAIPFSENLPSGSSIRPGDIIRHRGGRTTEVMNTDAEGRLLLADTLSYLTEKDPEVIIDTATLSGAVMIALGEELFGVFGTDAGAVRDVLAAAEAVGEHGWELPLWEGYRRFLESPIADSKNTGVRWGGGTQSALFLQAFVGDRPWVHIDVAGTAFHEKAGDYSPKGATGSPVRTIVRYILDRAAKSKTTGQRGRSRAASRS